MTRLEEIDAALAAPTSPERRLELEQERAKLRGSSYYRGQLVPHRIYNYPWSGKLGRVARECLVCGDTGASFSLSSASTQCLKCLGKEHDPDREHRYEARLSLAVDKWCLQNGINRKETVARLYAAFGEPDQDMVVLRDDLEVREALASVTPEEWAHAKKRQFPPHVLEDWFRYGQIIGSPGDNPFTDGPAFKSPSE